MIREGAGAAGLRTGAGPLDLEQIEAAIDQVALLDDAAVAGELVEYLGATLTAAVGDVGTTRLVRDWMNGTPPLRGESLRAALKAARVIVAAEGPAVARRWFHGTNRFFNHRSPLEVIREGTPEARTQLVRAALAFIT